MYPNAPLPTCDHALDLIRARCERNLGAQAFAVYGTIRPTFDGAGFDICWEGRVSWTKLHSSGETEYGSHYFTIRANASKGTAQCDLLSGFYLLGDRDEARLASKDEAPRGSRILFYAPA